MSFVGSYTNTVKAATLAAAASGKNVVIAGAPGAGKTAIVYAVVDHLTSGRFSFTELSPGTKPSTIFGRENPLALMEGREETITTGTPVDPENRMVILDELSRTSDLITHGLLHILDRKGHAFPPPVVSTANYLPEDPRFEALLDRLALVVWIKEDIHDTAAFVRAQWDTPEAFLSDLPDWEAIVEARTARPGDRAIAALAEIDDALTHEVAESKKANGVKGNYYLSPRRRGALARILHSWTVLQTGHADYNTVDGSALAFIQYAFPAMNQDDHAQWKALVSMFDQAAAVQVETVMAQALDELRRVYDAESKSERQTLITSLGRVVTKAESTLRAILGENSEEFKAQTARLNKILQSAIDGKPLDRSAF